MIEIIVSLGIFAVVLVALLPQLIVGIKATGTARVVSQAKGVGQGQLERLRHLPFHIAPAAGDYVDVLDKYFHDLGTGSTPTCTNANGYVTPAASWEGYVAADAARCDYEPPAGAFFRTVETTAEDAGIRAFTVVTDVQFLTGATPPQPVAPAADYDTGDDRYDNPPSSQVGVTVTVFYDRDGEARPVTVHSQISQRFSSPERVRAEADARILEVGSTTSGGFPVSLQAGLVHLAGGVSFGSTARASLVSVSGELGDGGTSSASAKTGAKLAVEAPPSVTTTLQDAASQFLGTDCVLACWGETLVPSFMASADDGRPLVGTSSSPAHVLIDGATDGGLSFVNGPTSGYRTGLQLDAPLVRLDTAAMTPSGPNGCTASGPASYLSAGGYLLTSDPEVDYEVESCAVGRSRAVELLDTTFAPDGLVQVELQGSSAKCRVAEETHVPATTYDYSAVVRYWNGTGYELAGTIVPGATTDPLATVPLATTSVGNDHVLGDYISSWSSVTTPEILNETANGVARLKIPGIVRIVTEPVRQDSAGVAVPSSAVSVTLGALDCLAEDQR